MQGFGSRRGQFAQLLALYEQDGVTQDDLCREVRIDQSTLIRPIVGGR